MLRILYLVPNLSDPAVQRRVSMFQLGGAAVEIAGFRRADAAKPDLDLDKVVELGLTHDARMLHRLAATLQASYRARHWGKQFSRPDVIVARNLEMLSVANRLMGLWPEPPRLVYECLDIHRLMLRQDNVGKAMRGAEQKLMRNADLLLTSSPAFRTNYFDIHGAPPVQLVENKVFGLQEAGQNPALTASPEPLHLGWFGALRCHKSLSALDQLGRDLGGALRITLRGRPALTEFNDFHGIAEASPHLDYKGAYRYPNDLASIYSEVHLVWAIDFFEEGQNSSWLLPNRVYEGCLNGAIPIALEGTETAAFIRRLGIGIVIPDISQTTLRNLFSGLTPDRVRALAADVARQDPAVFRCDAAECQALVQRLSGDAQREIDMVAAA